MNAIAFSSHALRAPPPQTQISFDVRKVTSFEDASAPFILYNSARVTSLVRKFQARLTFYPNQVSLEPERGSM